MMSDVHSCSYFCEKPACIKAQRDELRNALFERKWKTLADDERDNIAEKYIDRDGAIDSFDLDVLLEEFEAKLKEKNT